MTSKKQKAPSRERYEEHHPVLAFRASADEKARLESDAEALGLSVGEYLRQRAGLSNAVRATPTPGGGINETLRKIEIKTVLAATRKTLTGPQWAPFQTVVEYSSAVSQIEYLETRTMDLPLGDLEAAVPGVLKRAEEATGLQTLNESLRTVRGRLRALEAQGDGLRDEIEQLEAEKTEREGAKAHLDAQIASRHATLQDIEAQIAGVRRQTGMTESEILQSLGDFGNFRTTLNWLASQRDRLNWECQQGQAALSRAQRELERTTANLNLVREVRDADFAAIATRFAMVDVFRLGDFVIKRETQEMVAQVYGQMVATVRFPPGRLASTLAATSADGASVAARTSVLDSRAPDTTPTGFASGPAKAESSGLPGRSEGPSLSRPTKPGSTVFVSIDDILQWTVSPRATEPSPSERIGHARRETATKLRGQHRRERASSRTPRPRNARGKTKGGSGGASARAVERWNKTRNHTRSQGTCGRVRRSRR